MKRFTQESLWEIYQWLTGCLAAGQDRKVVPFEVLDPDFGGGVYSGERIKIDSVVAVHRGYRCWVDLAEQLDCRMLTPQPCDATGFVRMRFEPLGDSPSFHNDDVADYTEKYGTGSLYGRIDKREEPSFLLALQRAYSTVKLLDGARILDLGVNTGDELASLHNAVGTRQFVTFEIVGVDHCASAVEKARERFGAIGHRFYIHDINGLEQLDLGRFDLIVSIGTLHSPGIDNAKTLLMRLIQHHLCEGGALILGFPNCRWTGGEAVYGAKSKNYSESELSLLFKDVDFAKRYLQQHKFRVRLTGKSYLFLTATRMPSAASSLP